MKKRKRGDGKGKDNGNSTGAAAAGTVEPRIPPQQKKQKKQQEKQQKQQLSSNWLQLQSTLDKPSRAANARKRKRAEALAGTTTAESEFDKAHGPPISLPPTSSDFSVTKVLALDCEMVGVGPGGRRNALARVSIVNTWGNVVYDKHVRPLEFVTDFRTEVSGVRKSDLRNAVDFWTVQKEVSELLQDHILVGHSLRNDLKVLLLSHPRRDIRDTQLYGPYRNVTGQSQALKQLATSYLGVTIQEGEHDSIEDARAALALYQRCKKDWERSLRLGKQPVE